MFLIHEIPSCTVYTELGTWRVLTSDALGIETYMQKEHTVHSPSMCSKIVWWFFSLSACSLHFPKMSFAGLPPPFNEKILSDKLQLFLVVENWPPVISS